MNSKVANRNVINNNLQFANKIINNNNTLQQFAYKVTNNSNKDRYKSTFNLNNNTTSTANNNLNNVKKSILKSSKIYQIINKKSRDKTTLFELNEELHNETKKENLNLIDNEIDGTYLHYLAQTAQSTEE